jgi:hypothetical protein
MDWSLSDPRLDLRAEICFKAIAAAPELSFPHIFRAPSDQVGFYRFINNKSFDFQDLMESVEENSFLQADSNDVVLAAHDTTQVVLGGKAESIDDFRKKPGRKRSGFFAHVSLLINANEESKEVFGPCGLTIWSRGNAVKEAPRWFNHVQNVEGLRPGRKTIHLMDREGDSYDIIGRLTESGHRFVIRLCHDRLISEAEAHRLFEFMSTKKLICKRDVELSRRKGSPYKHTAKIHPPRERRLTELSVTASAVNFKRGDWASKDLPRSLKVNVVRVFEQNPPSGEKPVEWFLVTTEPIETEDQILRIIDYYRKRWMIEEFFKALKTGCSLEKRLLESAEAWYKIFVLFLPVAANLMNLREMGGVVLKNTSVLSPAELEVLKIQAKQFKMPLKTIGDAKMVIARIGGYSKTKWPPGWIILGRGYEQLRSWAKGYSYASNKYL